MNKSKNIKLLKALYDLKELGIEYIDNPNKNKTGKQTYKKNLPNNLLQLKKIVSNCYLCQLSKTRNRVVFGEGNENADIFFIGEGPGANEDMTGRPFIGKAGELLTKIIENVLEMKRENVYIGNIVKCRPPNNRVPTEDEATTCIPYLLKQIEIIKPKIIVTLGATAYRYLTGDKTSISKIRGEVLNYNGIKIIPTFHPSFLLRNPSAKKFVFLDMKKVKSLMV